MKPGSHSDAAGGRIGAWEPNEQETALLRKAAREAFEYMCDGHPYRFEGEVLGAVRFAIGGSGTILLAIQQLTQSLLRDWDRGLVSSALPDCPPPDWWDDVSSRYESVGDGEVVYRLDAEEDTE